jgi:cob(I)alamin adenosyltransferase
MRAAHLQVYTGPGKGKTTAAVGLAVRAKSRGLSVLFAQFMKSLSGGETDLLEKLGVHVIRLDSVASPVFNPDIPIETLRQEALKALDSLRQQMGTFDLVVLDEFNHLLDSSLITRDEAIGFIETRLPEQEMVLTGRGAPGWLLDMADLVTEMKEVKHPHNHGKKARKGIEF